MDLKDGTDIAPFKVFQVKDRGCVVFVFLLSGMLRSRWEEERSFYIMAAVLKRMKLRHSLKI